MGLTKDSAVAMMAYCKKHHMEGKPFMEGYKDWMLNKAFEGAKFDTGLAMRCSMAERVLVHLLGGNELEFATDTDGEEWVVVHDTYAHISMWGDYDFDDEVVAELPLDKWKVYTDPIEDWLDARVAKLANEASDSEMEENKLPF